LYCLKIIKRKKKLNIYIKKDKMKKKKKKKKKKILKIYKINFKFNNIIFFFK